MTKAYVDSTDAGWSVPWQVMPDTNPACRTAFRSYREIVRHPTGTLSGITPECCPPSFRNPVRHGAERAASVPADLLDPTLSGLRRPKNDQESAIIDIDHFKDNADMDPNAAALEQFIRELQGPMSTLFKDAVTTFACEQWNAK